MMRIISLSITILIVIFSFSACQKSSTNIIKTKLASYQPTEATYRDYKINVPLNWKLKEHYKSGTLRVLSPYVKNKPNKFQKRVVVVPMKGQIKYNTTTQKMETQKINLEDFSHLHLETLKRTLSNFKALEVGEMTIHGQRAKRFVYSYQDKEEYDGNLKALVYLISKGDEAFIINCLEDKQEFRNTEKIFEEVVKSFEFISKKSLKS